MVGLKATVMLIAQQRQKGQKGKKKVEARESDDSEEDSEGGLGKLPGARGAMAGAKLRASMSKHPKLFTERMERNVTRALEIDRITTHAAALYAAMWVPVGNQRTLGHLVTLGPRACRLCGGHDGRGAEHPGPELEGRLEACRHRTAVEGVGLHGRPGIRRAWSRLEGAQCLAAIIPDLKDEDFLVKRRTASPGPRKGGGRPADAKEGQ